MKLEFRTLPDGEHEIYDVDHEITVDTSLNAFWMHCIIKDGTINFMNFDKESLCKIINLLAEEAY